MTTFLWLSLAGLYGCNESGTRTPSIDGGPDMGENTCTPACEAGRICLRGRCVLTDLDNDGVASTADCDDTNPNVRSEAPCVCARGEECQAGEWLACVDLVTSCTCAEGDSRDVVCGMCGDQRQVCSATGGWMNEGSCMTEGACSAGVTDTTSMPGFIRTCQDDCTWSTYTATICTGACSPGQTRMASPGCTESCEDDCTWGPPECCSSPCMPGATMDRTEECGRCGRRTFRATCQPNCMWGAEVQMTNCQGQGECDAGATRPTMRSCGNCTRMGTQTGTQRCSDTTCRWTDNNDWGTCTGDPECRSPSACPNVGARDYQGRVPCLTTGCVVFECVTDLGVTDWLYAACENPCGH